MSQHTPGPWTFTKNDDGVRRIKAPSHAGSLMCDERYYPWCPAEDADWRLIAAAPDLLAALREAQRSLAAVAGLLATYPRPSNDPHGRTLLDSMEHAKAASQAARAVLAKAREGATD